MENKMNKKIRFILITVVAQTFIFGFFNHFPENPAEIADREHSEIYVPGFQHSFRLQNSLLTMKEFGTIFQEGHFITDEEKKTLTRKDLELSFRYNADLLSFGRKYWNVKFTADAFGSVNILDKQYTELVLYGNEADKQYTANSGEGSSANMLFRTIINYAYPTPFVFETPVSPIKLHLGANVNFYFPELYAEAVKSTQEFGSMQTGAYYDLNSEYLLSDEKSYGRLSPGIGLGAKAEFLNGNFHFSLDDIFGVLRYKNLLNGSYENVYEDTLFYFEEDFEPFEEETIDDSSRISEKNISIPTAVSVGAEYLFLDNYTAFVKYKYSMFTAKNGFSLGVGYDQFEMPIQLSFGIDEEPWYEVRTGFIYSKFELLFSGIFYNGFFDNLKGFGVETGLKFKF